MAKQRRKFTQCPNCAYTFEKVNNYCPNCGQENHNLNVPLKHLVWEFLEGTLHYDTKFWRTLKHLLLKPGSLTEKFNLGQRASYVPPFRLYVFVSLVFFFLLAISKGTTNNELSRATANELTFIPGMTIRTDLADSLSALNKRDSLNAIKPALMPTASARQTKSDFSDVLGAKLKNFIQKGEASKSKLLKNLSFMMFILMPFFALLLQVFYSSQNRNYVEHLMFSVHLHTFYFILLIIAMPMGILFPQFDINVLVISIMALYLFVALRRVYKKSYFTTLLYLLPIGLIYTISLLVFFVSTLAISIYMS